MASTDRRKWCNKLWLLVITPQSVTEKLRNFATILQSEDDKLWITIAFIEEYSTIADD